MHTLTRRSLLKGAVVTAGVAATGLAGRAFAAEPGDEALRTAYREWLGSLPAAPAPELTRHGLVGTELKRWHIMEANQGVAVDAEHFYGIGNHALVKHRKDTGERVAEWFGPRNGAIIHLNSGWLDGDRLVLSHSNFSQLPMASSLEIYDARTLQPLESHALGLRLGSLTWAVRRDGFWWACFANYNDGGTTPGFDQRWTHVAKFNDDWQELQAWLFPPQVIATWGDSACSGGDWGEGRPAVCHRPRPARTACAAHTKAGRDAGIRDHHRCALRGPVLGVGSQCGGRARDLRHQPCTPGSDRGAHPRGACDLVGASPAVGAGLPANHSFVGSSPVVGRACPRTRRHGWRHFLIPHAEPASPDTLLILLRSKHSRVPDLMPIQDVPPTAFTLAERLEV
jgi:hypothetical protein